MKLAVPVLLILAGLFGLIAMGIAQGGVPELQVEAMLANERPDGVVKVHGMLGTIHSNERPLRFTVLDKEDPEKAIEVYCDRTRPDTFQESYEVAVQGRWNPETDRFEADHIFTKCPSKYEAEAKEGLGGPPLPEGYAPSDAERKSSAESSSNANSE